MAIVPVGAAIGSGRTVAYSQYGAAVRPVGETAVGAGTIVPALDWSGTVGSEDDPELPDWVDEEYGGLHEGLETVEVVAGEPAPVTVSDENGTVSDIDVIDFDALPEGFNLVPVEVVMEPEVAPVKRKPGRPKGSTNKVKASK